MIDKTTQIKPNTTPILFVNWTDEDFTWSWNSEETSIPKGTTLWLPCWLAQHFAKHLVDRELNKLNLRTDHHSRESYIAKCIGNKADAIADKNDDPLGIKLLNANLKNEPVSEPELDVAPKRKQGRPPKVKVSDEATFEGK